MNNYDNCPVCGMPRHVYRFGDKDSPKFEGGSESADDFNTLLEDGCIEATHTTYGQDASGGKTRSNPAVKIIPDGFVAVAGANKWWIQTAIDKEPITFLQIVITI